ncbi:MAG: nuclear transport factor 2 family protein [Jannaschia sp.]
MEAEPTAGPDLLVDLVAAETAIWQALVEGDAQADGAALHPSFLGVYGDGCAGRDAHAAQLADGPTVADFTLGQTRVTPLGDEVAILSYRAIFTRPGGDAPEAAWVSSVWRRAGAGWVNLFRQDTPAAP